MMHNYQPGQRVRIIAGGSLGTVEDGDTTGATVIEDDGDVAWFVAADITPLTSDTVPVWIAEHDDESVQYVVNDRNDMQSNYNDGMNVYFETVDDYLDSWHSFDMPRYVFDSPRQQDRIDWIDLNQ